MDELRRSEERLEKLRADLLAAESELNPLEASWRERTDREVEELVAFAKERGHSWTQHKETEESVRWLLRAGFYGAGFEEGGPHYKEREKVARLKSKIKWWENKVLKEKLEARKAQAVAQALAKRNE